MVETKRPYDKTDNMKTSSINKHFYEDADRVDELFEKYMAPRLKNAVFPTAFKFNYVYKVILDMNKKKLLMFEEGNSWNYLAFDDVVMLDCSKGIFELVDNYFWAGQSLTMLFPLITFSRAIGIRARPFDIKGRLIQLHFKKINKQKYEVMYLATLIKTEDNKYETDRILFRSKGMKL
jgi:hypothetical protein